MSSRRQPIKANALHESMDRYSAREASIKRWDGNARTSGHWDHLHRDPELWFQSGNCLVHLYAKGQSKRGPSFKVPFTTLLNMKCYPLVKRFIAWEGIQLPEAQGLVDWSRKNPSRRVDLFIPPPSGADSEQAHKHHLTIRNLLAWVFNASIVGETLGGALVGLVYSMHEFRSGVKDNMADAMGYLEEKGYTDLCNEPKHSLGLLYFAEVFRARDVYIRSFIHCVGMSGLLFDSMGYQQLSTNTKQLIRRTRREMEGRLSRSTTMLKTFLDKELSESHLGISNGARAHLEKFRSFLLSYYTSKLGYYPPKSVNSRHDFFDASVFRRMRKDFDALYELLVDGNYTDSDIMSPVAAGGICTVQLVHSFGLCNDYKPLEHPLSLIPETQEPVHSRRMSWLPGREKFTLDNKLAAQAALNIASNLTRPDVVQNELVRAYQRFEEQSITNPDKSSHHDKVSIVDARKVRWIMIYAIYQVVSNATETPAEVVSNATETPAEVGRDHVKANYSLSVPTSNLPPWKETLCKDNGLRIITGSTMTSSSHTGGEKTPDRSEMPQKIEIKPDIDYFALTHKDPGPQRRDSAKMISDNSRSTVPSPPNSISRAITRSSTIRRSMRIFRSHSVPAPYPVVPATLISHHQILVNDYGNGTNNICSEREEAVFGTPQWNDPYDMHIVERSMEEHGAPSLESSGTSTMNSSIKEPSPICETFNMQFPTAMDMSKPPRRRRDVVSMVTRSMSTASISRKPRPASAFFHDKSRYAAEYEEAVDQQQQSIFGAETLARSITGSFNRHSNVLSDLKLRGFLSTDSRSAPVPTPKKETVVVGEEPYVMPHDADWTAMQEFMDRAGCGGVEMVDDDVKPAWEQYADLGGLTEMR